MEELGSYPAVTLEEQLGGESQENERDKPQHVAQPRSHVRLSSNFNNRTAHVTIRHPCNFGRFIVFKVTSRRYLPQHLTVFPSLQ